MEERAGGLLEQAIAAHGGRELWESAREISARLSSGGLAFASKLQGAAVRDVEARVSTRGQRVTFIPYPRAGQRGILEPDGSVRIETDTGEVLERRERARDAFADLRHKLWWDRLDILYGLGIRYVRSLAWVVSLVGILMVLRPALMAAFG